MWSRLWDILVWSQLMYIECRQWDILVGSQFMILNICGFEFKIEFKKMEIKYLNGSLKFVEIGNTEILHHQSEQN
jgi:hypothetical protein